MEEIINEFLKNKPLKTRFNTQNMISIIDLITELGYREEKPWGPDEQNKLSTIAKRVEELSDVQINHINNWESDGKPE